MSNTYRVTVLQGTFAVWSDKHGEEIATGLTLAQAQREVEVLRVQEIEAQREAAEIARMARKPVCYVCGRWDGSHSGGCQNPVAVAAERVAQAEANVRYAHEAVKVAENRLAHRLNRLAAMPPAGIVAEDAQNLARLVADRDRLLAQWSDRITEQGEAYGAYDLTWGTTPRA